MITSTANARIKQIRALHRRKERDQAGLCFVEGIRLVTAAVESGALLESLVVAPELLKSGHARAIVGVTERSGVPVLDVSRAVFESISSKEGPQGLAAVVRQRWFALEDIDPAAGLCWIALDAAQDPGNIGTILRTADAVGAAGLILTGRSADPHDPEAVRASMGALFTQSLARASWDALVAWARERSVVLVGTSDKGATDFQAIRYPAPRVLVMGSEREGLHADQQAACDVMARIPMVGHSDSLNLAVATTVMLYEFFNQARHAEH
ncbi:MAG: RNA methyltransferase [Chloroflexi bacterium]|nr:RNA methyltransferase [Chloroflexota bacterium]